jgi:hypothetical protein
MVVMVMVSSGLWRFAAGLLQTNAGQPRVDARINGRQTRSHKVSLRVGQLHGRGAPFGE